MAKSAYPDDQHQSRMDRIDPPRGKLKVRTPGLDQARHHQGGGTTGEVGGDRPAEVSTSPIAPIDGRDRLPGDGPERLGETHWDDDLIYPIQLAHPQVRLKTLRDAGRLLSGEITNMVHSAALQLAAKKLVRAAKTGTVEDVSAATDDLDRLVRTERLM
ncbi:hypothetical protein ABLE91_17005 [Aquabacter sp. CN5-332]|uniref:hypothetical protein n=1 Tax=Aquabacter sp. CN5-332 TaxID=3156608 RepID=UPI0032B33161